MERRARRPAALVGLALALLAPPAASQAGAPRALVPASAAARSLVAPGWGQWAQGQRRGVAYAAAEVLLWALWVERRDAGGDLRGAYRDLAWRTGRIPAGERRDGPWDYFEALSKWTRSGAFDRDATAPGLQPEEDPLTFNGSVWALARGIHFGGGSPAPGDPKHDAALAWYRERAYADGFLWDWSGREGDMTEYRGLIRRSDDRFREATWALGGVVGNHLLSAADAFVSARIPGSAELRLVAPDAWTGAAPWLALTWTPPS
ncbi:MAG: hypothetical protein ACYC6F_17465 [Longimicrobiales bacterium]